MGLYRWKAYGHAGFLVTIPIRYTPQKAIAVGHLLEEHGSSHYEEPCPFGELEWTAEVAAALKIAVAGGEQDNDLAQWRRTRRPRKGFPWNWLAGPPAGILGFGHTRVLLIPRFQLSGEKHEVDADWGNRAGGNAGRGESGGRAGAAQTAGAASFPKASGPSGISRTSRAATSGIAWTFTFPRRRRAACR